MRLSKKLFPIAASLILIAPQAEASFPGISQDKYIRAFILGNENTPIYTTNKLNVQGTAKPYKEYDSVLYPTTEVHIYEVCDDWAYVSYNAFWAGKREGYVKLSALTSKNYSLDARRATKRFDDIYKKNNGELFKNSAIYKGDAVYTLAKDNDYVQIVYPAAEVYKMAWVKKGEYDKYVQDEKIESNGERVALNLKVPNVTFESLFTIKNDEELPTLDEKSKSLLVVLAMKYSHQTGTKATPAIVKSKNLMSITELFPKGLKELDFEYLNYHSEINNSILNGVIINLAQNKPVIIGKRKTEKSESYALITSYNGVNTGKFATKNFIVYDPITKKETSLAQWLGSDLVSRVVF